MAHYETILILDPQLEDEVIAQRMEQIEQVISSHHGEVVSVDLAGRKKLAYSIKDRQQGHYSLFRFNGDQRTLSELERQFRLDESVLRYLTVSVGHHDGSKISDFDMDNR